MKVLLRDKDFVEKMEEKVRPFLTNRINSGFFETIEGQPIYYEHYEADDKKGTVVIVHGFTEFIRKLDEVMYYFLKGGYSVWAIEQRGHGSSYKTATDPDVVQIDDYNDLIEDLHYMVVNLVMKDCSDGLPRILYGHSMGGAVSACFAERYPDIFDRIMDLGIMKPFKPFYIKYKMPLLYLFFGGLTTVLSIFLFWLFCTVIGGKPMTVDEQTLQRVKDCHAFLRQFANDRIIYGINTGFGEEAPVDVQIRPEDIQICAPEQGQFQGIIKQVVFKGTVYDITVLAAGFEWLVQTITGHEQGSEVGLRLAPANIQIMAKPASEDEEAVSDE